MLYLVSRRYDEEGELESEIEFELGKYDTVDDMLLCLKKMNDAKLVVEIDDNYGRVLNHLANWVMECYNNLIRKRVEESREDVHDARIQPLGGE